MLLLLRVWSFWSLLLLLLSGLLLFLLHVWLFVVVVIAFVVVIVIVTVTVIVVVVVIACVVVMVIVTVTVIMSVVAVFACVVVIGILFVTLYFTVVVVSFCEHACFCCLILSSRVAVSDFLSNYFRRCFLLFVSLFCSFLFCQVYFLVECDVGPRNLHVSNRRQRQMGIRDRGYTHH